MAWHSSELRRVWFAITDHFEPLWNRVGFDTGLERVKLWRERLPQVAELSPKDCRGNRCKYTFFFPEEEYRPEFIQPLAELTREGMAEVEVHIHHDREGRDNFIARMRSFCETLYRDHGLLRLADGKIRFAFIHGNWALDNSLPGGQWCGLNDEISILRDLGCYADFTMPSGNSPSQARTVNQIYWATDDHDAPKSYDSGSPVSAVSGSTGDLLMIPGPFGLRWRNRILPRMETGELAGNDPATEYRVKRWLDLAPRIGHDLFLKLYSHGTQERNSSLLLNGGLQHALTLLSEGCERRGVELHYVSAWQMYQQIMRSSGQPSHLDEKIRSRTPDRRVIS
jgi:hypothetical protein